MPIAMTAALLLLLLKVVAGPDAGIDTAADSGHADAGRYSGDYSSR